MKKKNKFLALLLAVSLTFSVSACGSTNAGNKDAGTTKTEGTSKDSATDLFAAAQANMKKVSSLNAQSVVDMAINLSANGETHSLDTVTTTSMSCFYNPTRIKMDLLSDAGENGTLRLGFYVEANEDGTYTMYTRDGSDWVAQPSVAEDIEQYDAVNNMASYMKESYQFKDDGSYHIDGRDVRKFTGTVTGEDLKKTLMSSGSISTIASLGLDSTKMDSILDDKSEVPVIVWIDETQCYPLRYEMDMTAVMNSLLSGILASMGDEAKSLSMEVTKLTVTMTCADFNAATEFTIPKDAKSTAAES